MILPFLLLLQNPAAAAGPAADRPIRLWMDASGPVTRGLGVRLYVQAAAPGNLVVLHARSDGRIEVLFPARPTDDPHITPGTWEVRGPNDGPVWTVSEPDGTGMILAALTPDPIWFDEFSHAASWAPQALRPSWSGADALGGMQDIVQRMLGDGGFTYDVLTYSVVPQSFAQSPDTGSTPPTIDNTEPDDAALTTCGVSSPVECSLLGQPQFLGGRLGHRRFGSPRRFPPSPNGGAPGAGAPAHAVAWMVLPVRRTPLAPADPALPRPAVRVLASRPVPGARPGRLAGEPAAARSALVLRYVRTPAVPRSRPGGPGGPVPSGPVPAVAPAPASPAIRAAPTGTVAAALPMRVGGLTLMSRAVAERPTAPRAASPVAARAAPVQSHGAVGAWMVVRARPRGR